MKNLLMKAAVIGALFTPLALHADPITGQFSLNGSVTPTLNTLTFDGPTVETSINTQTGDFATILGEGHVAATGGSTVITYNPYPGGAFVQFPTLTVLIDTFMEQSVVLAGLPFQIYSGTATFQAAGFDDTPGTFSFSTQGTGEVSFSATGVATGIAATPEPSSLALLGTATIAGAGFLKKRLFA
jgi:PEP-CTERM motif